MNVGSRQNDRGFILLVVIVVMLMVSFLASQLILQVRTELKIAANRSDHIAERMLAEGGINLALFRLLGNAELDVEEFFGGPFMPGKVYETVFPNGKIEYYAVSEEGKIDLNSSKLDLLMLFLEYHGLDEDERAVVKDSLDDWKDNDGDLYRINGAERDYYEGLERPYAPRNAAIGDPGEFFMIRGTDKVSGLFDPYEVFTVQSQGRGRGQINFNSLTPAMLDFLTAGDQESKDLYWELREEVPNLSATHAQQVLGDRFATFTNYLTFGNPGNSIYYSIVAVGLADKKGGDEDKAENSEQPEVDSGKKNGVKVSTLVRRGGSMINYLSWRISYT